ncbi:MAG: sugar nucleotide-binding protein, partial [Anaerobutyricum sp.]
TAQSSAKRKPLQKTQKKVKMAGEKEDSDHRKRQLCGNFRGGAWLKTMAWSNTRLDTLDMRTQTWRTHDFSAYDVVYHVAGIAHADVGQVSEEEKKQYYRVNTDLAVETAEKAKREGVQQFLFMSSMIVYSGCKEKKITKNTIPKPLNFYGDSKWQADQKIQALADERFKVVCIAPTDDLRKGIKGKLSTACKTGRKASAISDCTESAFHALYRKSGTVCQTNDRQRRDRSVFSAERAVYQYFGSVQMIAVVKGHRLVMVPGTGWAVRLMKKIPGKIGTLTGKAFGDSVYDMQMSEYKEEYRVCDWKESVRRTEG